MGNITAISGSSNANYTYDDFGQLLSETVNGDTFTYSYDEVGNLLTATDYIGAHSYTYDADGLRLTKTVNGVEHKYVWQGGRLVSEYYDGKELEFFYDESGAPYALSYKSGASAAPVMYYYVTNLQGDVVRLLDSSGSIKASYAYSAWGKLIDVSGDMADINPLRYRGYYYDADTDLYYLKSRYYDPQICRFINADELASTGQGILGTNMFAYCLNNPVNMFDETGTWPSWATKLVTAVAVVAVVATVAAITVSTAGAGTAVAVIAVSAAKGSAIGMATGAAIGAGTNAINHRISTGSWSGAGTAALNGMGDGALSGAITGAVTGAASSAVKVGQAARAFDNGTFRSGYQSMKYHYNKHVVREGLNRRTNILQYADDAINFSNRNASMLRYKYNYNYGNASWNFAYSSGQGGMYTSTGKVLTFWYR